MIGHDTGVWAVCLISSGGRWRGGDEDTRNPPPRWARELGELKRDMDVAERASDPACASEGWGQPGALVVSGGCDKEVRVWDVQTGCALFFSSFLVGSNCYSFNACFSFRVCIHQLPGHASTIRCIRVLHHRPLAVSGSRDGTLRVWDVRAGTFVRVLAGHDDSVRALDAFGDRVVSGSYDRTCRVCNFAALVQVLGLITTPISFGMSIRANVCTSFVATTIKSIQSRSTGYTLPALALTQLFVYGMPSEGTSIVFVYCLLTDAHGSFVQELYCSFTGAHRARLPASNTWIIRTPSDWWI
jgi:hypothetical protein